MLELVAGESLADRLNAGAVPLREATDIAKQIASAMEAAHEKGIIHRDLKPANVMITADGQVKVLDFGLGKMMEGELSTDVSNSPTMTLRATQVGMILGTAAYMSPEQAKGRVADKRSDIWSFGCVLYEMLTGKRPFEGEDVSDTLATVLKNEPDWTRLPANLQPAIQTLVQRCLIKDRRDRIADMSTARFLLSDTGGAYATSVPTASPLPTAVPPIGRRVLTYVAVAAVAAVAAGGGVWWFSRPGPLRVTRLLITPDADVPLSAVSIISVDRSLAITPDGLRVIYIGTGGSIVVRRLDQIDGLIIKGLGATRGPFVSPDGQEIGYFDTTQQVSVMKKVKITGGPAVQLCQLDEAPLGATWLPDGTIIFATRSAASGLQRVSAAGGEVTVLTRPDRAQGEADHFWPQGLPDGHSVLFTTTSIAGGLDNAAVSVFDLRSGKTTKLLTGGYDGRYSSTGHLVYGAAGTLRAVSFDPARMRISGTPTPVVPSVLSGPQGAVAAALAADGTLAYISGNAGASIARTLVWVDRQGRETPLAAPPRAYTSAKLSPDGTKIVTFVFDQDQDLWIWDVVRQTLSHVTFDAGRDFYPAWFPDSHRLAFSSERGAARNVFRQTADGTGSVDRLTDSVLSQSVNTVTPDGKTIVFHQNNPTTGTDLMSLSVEGDHTPVALLQTRFDERNAVISVDGWLAYEANDTGPYEIYVRRFSDMNSWYSQVSMGGGTKPIWSRDGRELFYLGPSGELMRVGVERSMRWSSTTPMKILEPRYFGAGAGAFGPTYDVALDGKRFLMIKQATVDQAGGPTSIVVVQHFGEELKQIR